LSFWNYLLQATANLKEKKERWRKVFERKVDSSRVAGGASVSDFGPSRMRLLGNTRKLLCTVAPAARHV
jgi:hypothetical protein